MSEGAKSFLAESAESTRGMGAGLARVLTTSTDPIVIALNGELGAGKTTLVNGLLTAFGAKGPIKSPTYTLIEPYVFDQRTVYHLDLYRLSDARELEMLGLRDLLVPGNVLLIEWAERGVRTLPTPDLTLNLAYVDGNNTAKRIITIQAGTSIGKGLAKSLQASADKAHVSP